MSAEKKKREENKEQKIQQLYEFNPIRWSWHTEMGGRLQTTVAEPRQMQVPPGSCAFVKNCWTITK